MPELKRKFQSGKMNKDLDERLVPNGEYRDALNIEVSTSESDDLGSAQTVMGNKLINNPNLLQDFDQGGINIPNPSSDDPLLGQWPVLLGFWDNTYNNKVIGKVVDEKNNWGYRLVSGPPPIFLGSNASPPPAFSDQLNYISADYIVRNNDNIEEPVLVDIYSVSAARHNGWTIPGAPVDFIHVSDLRGLRLGMELNVYVVDINGTTTNITNINTNNRKPPKITGWGFIGPGRYKINLSAKVNLSQVIVNNFVFTAPRVLNFEHHKLITGINIFDDFLLWTDNHTEPKKVHIEKSVLGCRYPFTSAGTNPFSYYHHTNFVTKKPSGSPKYWIGDEPIVSLIMSQSGRPIEEKHITVIKESPYLTPVLEMVKDRGDVNTTGRVVNNDPQGIGGGPWNPFFNTLTTTEIEVDDEVWIRYGGPNSGSQAFYDLNGVLQIGAGPELVDTTTGIANPGCSPVWTATCSIDFSIVPFYQAGDIILFTDSSGLLEIRVEVLLGPDWNYGSYKVKVINKSGDIDAQDMGWTSQKESYAQLFQYKFPRFATRYKYEDGEYSTYSPFTEVAFLPGKNPMDYLPEKGYNLNMTNSLSELAIKGFAPHNELLPDDVESIEIVYKESDSSNIYSITSVERSSPKWFALDGIGNTTQGNRQWDKTSGYVKITSEMMKGTIAPNQLLRPWDMVPRKALGQEITGNRLLYGNYLQNYDLSTTDIVNCGPGSNINCEPNLEIETDVQFSIPNGNVGVKQPEEEKVGDAKEYGPAKSIKTLRTYQLGVVYRDKYGRETPVFSNTDMTTYLEKPSADKASYFETQIRNMVPDFAESFKFFVKETSNEYYNLPMDRWYHAEDGNIWLSFPSSERSKLTVATDEERFENSFLILKKQHDNNAFVPDPAKYKILAIENDAPTFIKTVKTPIGTLTGQGITVGFVDSVFKNDIVTEGFPTPMFNIIRIPTISFEDQGWQDSIMGPNAAGFGNLMMRIGTATIKSDWYTITSVARQTCAANPPLPACDEYEITVERNFAGDMVFNQSSTLSLEIVKEEVKWLPEFDGRFFVKIFKDATLDQQLLNPNLTGGQYTVVSSIQCQVIDPNSAWSDVTHADHTPSDGWDGWGTVNDSSNLVQADAYTIINTSTNENTFNGNYHIDTNWGDMATMPPNGTPTSHNLIMSVGSYQTGLDWTSSEKIKGTGELYWQSFEAQDNQYGSGAASRWFIDSRSGTDQMFQTYLNMPAQTPWGDDTRNQHDFEYWATGPMIGRPVQNQNAPGMGWGAYGSGTDAPTWPNTFNAVVPSIPNNPQAPQDSGDFPTPSTGASVTNVPTAVQREFGTGVPLAVPGPRGDIGQNTVQLYGWSNPDPNSNTPWSADHRFKSPSEGIYPDVNGDLVYIDLSCMGFGGPELAGVGLAGGGAFGQVGTGPNNAAWKLDEGVPYGMACGQTARNCNTPWLNDGSVNAQMYANDLVFINYLTTDGCQWRWAQDPDEVVYETVNTSANGAVISDWLNTGGTLGGWKKVGESSIHFNTQTVGMTMHTGNRGDWGNAGLNNYTDMSPAGGGIRETPHFYNKIDWLNYGFPGEQMAAYMNNRIQQNKRFGGRAANNPWTGIVNQYCFEDLLSCTSSNTSNWNRSQRWTIEARTKGTGDALGSGVAGYLPTNDPRWKTNDLAHNNTAGAAPGVRHDGMGAGQIDTTHNSTSSTDATGEIHPPNLYDDIAGITSGTFTWQILLPTSTLNAFNSTGAFSSTNPAIWETQPKIDIDLDIYYEIGQIYATKLNKRTSLLHAPVGSQVRIWRDPNSPYSLANPGVPTGWIPWMLSLVPAIEAKMYIHSWNDLPIGIFPLDPSFPNEIKLVDYTGSYNGVNSPMFSPMWGDILVFYRADGSTTEAKLWDVQAIPSLQGQFIGNKASGIFTLEEEIGNRRIRPPWFNCYSFGNGVESNRIRDDFNEVVVDKGPKASSTISVPYKEERRGGGLIFSGIFNSKTGVNNLNQFIGYEGITKDLNPSYGSIQKLHSRDTDIIALCEEKCLRVLANKNALYNADGNINMISTSNVLGQAVAYAGDYGISKNPESFASASFRMYFTDKSKGSVLRLSQDGLTPISKAGMNDWFSDNLPNAYEIIGSIDERKGDYNITLFNHNLDITNGMGNSVEFGGNTVTFNERVKGWSSFKSFLQETGFSLNNNYYTARYGNIWKHHVDQPTPRNSFYEMASFSPNYPTAHTESSITFLFNEQPGSVKSFGTLNYEGSQSRITQDILTPDTEYYDNWVKKGWYVNKMTTNLQEIDQLEFKDKEGKWFSRIKGSATTLGNIDPREFSFQGLDVANIDPTVGACVWGCTSSTATNYNPIATCDDGSCIACIYGCVDPLACNFDASATCDDGSCLTIYGCTNPMATNYDPAAQCDDGSCILPVACDDLEPHLKDGDGKIEISCGTNGPGSGPSTASVLSFWVDTGCNPPGTCTNTPNYDYEITDSSGNIIGTGINQQAGSGIGGIVVISPIPFAPATLPLQTNYFINVWETVNTLCTYSGPLATIGNDFLTYGCTDNTAINYVAPMPDCDDGSCIMPLQNFGCMRLNAFNYDPAAANVCNGLYSGCTTVANSNSYMQPACDGPGFGNNGQCCVNVVTGCTDGGNANPPDLVTNGPYANTQAWWIGWGYDTAFNVPNYSGVAANNYSPLANTEDGSCDYNTGCTNPSAYSTGLMPGYNAYNANATIDNGSCCLIAGCTDSLASNYDATACSNDGSCIYPIYGCTNPLAYSALLLTGYSAYNVNATIDDGSCCLVEGCTDNSQSNYDPLACSADGSCIPFIYGCTDDGLQNQQWWDDPFSNNTGIAYSTILPAGSTTTYPGTQALNHYPAANIDNGTCTYCVHGCTSASALNWQCATALNPNSLTPCNDNVTCDDGTCVYGGCTDAGLPSGPDDMTTQGPYGTAPYTTNQEWWDGWGYDTIGWTGANAMWNSTTYAGGKAWNYGLGAQQPVVMEDGSCIWYCRHMWKNCNTGQIFSFNAWNSTNTPGITTHHLTCVASKSFFDDLESTLGTTIALGDILSIDMIDSTNSSIQGCWEYVGLGPESPPAGYIRWEIDNATNFNWQNSPSVSVKSSCATCP